MTIAPGPKSIGEFEDEAARRGGDKRDEAVVDLLATVAAMIAAITEIAPKAMSIAILTRARDLAPAADKAAPSHVAPLTEFIAAQRPMDADLANAARKATDQMLADAPPALSSIGPFVLRDAAQRMADAVGAHDNQSMPWSVVRSARENLLSALKGLPSASPSATREASAPPEGWHIQHPDTERLDWLEDQHVEVRTPLVYGSRALFHASSKDGDGSEEPSDIRAQIDGEMAKDRKASIAFSDAALDRSSDGGKVLP